MQAIQAPGSFRRAPLFWRVFAMNAGVLVAATTLLAVSPATVSQPVAVREAVVLIFGISAMLVANVVLLRRALAPLERLMGLMREVDPLRPGQRIPLYDAGAEVTALTRSFNEMLDRLEAERRDSARRALAAQESERRRVSRELHDEIGQAMTGVVLQLERTVRALPDGEARQLVVESREAVRDSLEDVRRIARELRPEALDDLGLPAALASLIASLVRRSDLEVQGRVAPDLPGLDPDVELVIYRVAQESLTNVARHARATRAKLSLAREDEQIVLMIADDGCGIDSPAAGPGSGIRGMRERALLIGARLTIDSSPSGGTEVRLSIPIGEAG